MRRREDSLHSRTHRTEFLDFVQNEEVKAEITTGSKGEDTAERRIALRPTLCICARTRLRFERIFSTRNPSVPTCDFGLRQTSFQQKVRSVAVHKSRGMIIKPPPFYDCKIFDGAAIVHTSRGYPESTAQVS